MKNKILMILFAGLFCGKAFALPQDWPCDEFVVSVVNENVEKNSYDFKGVKGDYELTLRDLGRFHPADCGTIGCDGTFKNLKTGITEDLRFDCIDSEEGKEMKCSYTIREEYWLRKFTDDEYRLTFPLCNLSGDYIKLSECKGCACTMKSIQKEGYENYQEELRCRLEKDILHCYNLQRYEEDNFGTYKDGDYENCVGLGGF